MKTLPDSFQAEPQAARSASWRALWPRRTAMFRLPSAMVLALPSVFGSDS
ncbi:hypothetical protein ACFPK5_18730 [Streptomyces beijiangensis]